MHPPLSAEVTVEPGAGVADRPRTGARRWLRRHAFEIALVTPLVVYVLVLTLAPIVDTIRLSLSGRGGGEYPSVETYGDVLDQEVFSTAI